MRQMDEKAAAAEKRERMQVLLDKVLGEAKAQRINELDFIRFLKKART